MWGGQDDEASIQAIHAAIDHGVNWIDTAPIYGSGHSEEVVGRAVKSLPAARRPLIFTKFGLGDDSQAPPSRSATRADVHRECDASLRRLGVDAIDLYQVHAPDPSVPLEAQLEALDALVRAGKVRALGASNFPAWLLAWSVALQDREGWAPFISLQPQYSLVERSIEVELLPFCRSAGLGVLPWGPLGAGFLTGQYKRGESPPEGSRNAGAAETLEEFYDRRAIERNFRVVDAAGEIAEARGATIAQVAIAWLLGTEGVTAPIIGPRTFDQLEDLLGADGLQLDAGERARLEEPAGPPPMYPQRMLHEQSGIDEVVELVRAR
jgi:aryl-alcohol dehydrogenase-like predicted oxidoreductase